MMSVKHTVREILSAPNVEQHIAKIYIRFVVQELANRLNLFVDIPYNNLEEMLSPWRVDIKGSCNYDGRREAVLFVVHHYDTPIVIGSYAGRELSDIESVHIYNYKSLINMLSMFVVQPMMDKDLDLDERIDVVFWEGTPIKLGKHHTGVEWD